MPSVTNKQRLLGQVFNSVAEKSASASSDDSPVLEQFIYGLCREGNTRERADQAYNFLRERFFDWNEVRVSSVREIEEVFSDLPDAEQRAQRLIAFLQEVFETTFSFDLESLRKKGLKQAAKHLARYQSANDYIVAWVTQYSLGGHAIPLDGPSVRVARRIGLIEEDNENVENIRGTLEHLVPKSRGSHFSEAMSLIADEFCFELEPNCSSCPLHSDCPTCQENPQPALAGSRVGRTKPR